MNGMANTLAYYYFATITAIKGFIVQAEVACTINILRLLYEGHRE